jgi:hypothetical protein
MFVNKKRLRFRFGIAASSCRTSRSAVQKPRSLATAASVAYLMLRNTADAKQQRPQRRVFVPVSRVRGFRSFPFSLWGRYYPTAAGVSIVTVVRKVSRKGVVHQSLFCDIDFVPRRIATKRQYLQSDHAIPNVATATFGIASIVTSKLCHSQSVRVEARATMLPGESNLESGVPADVENPSLREDEILGLDAVQWSFDSRGF